MKSLIAFICLGSAVLAVEIGDSYENVIAEKGKPQSQAVAGDNRITNYPDGSIHFHGNVVTAIKLKKSDSASAKPQSSEPPRQSENPPEAPTSKDRASSQDVAALKNRQLTAVNRVKAIVNQPVRSVRRTGEMKVSIFQPGWFHDGAELPEFSEVDVRKTQETTYDRFEYVTSDLNPGIAFRGREIEFNRMTKYFYENLNLPKKKLLESEMREINRLYRVIAECEEQLRRAEEL